jgi:hypothetical protein
MQRRIAEYIFEALMLTLVLGVSLTAEIILDETWTLTVAGQSMQVNPDGSFTIPNISAADEFGPDGPGSRPDFLSDDFLRVTGYSTVDGVTRYVFSEPFRIMQGETYIVEELIFTLTPPPFPESIRVTTDIPTLTSIGETTQARVEGTLIDGSVIDLTPQTAWTTYHTSNPDIASINVNGVVTAVDRGRVFITATNEGAAAVTQVDVSPGDPLTTVTGIILDGNGLPAAGVTVTLIGLGGTAVTDAIGIFTIPGVSTAEPIRGVIARRDGDDPLFGMASQLDTVAGGFTDAGLITVNSCVELGIDCVDTDNDCLPDVLETAMGLNPQLPDSDDDGIPDGEEDSDGDGLINCPEVIQGTDPSKSDSDGDDLDDSDELFIHGTDPTMADTDLDSIPDGQELILGTDPVDDDTDNDTWNDESEVTAGSDPLDVNSRPSLLVSANPVTRISISGFKMTDGVFNAFVIASPVTKIGLPGVSLDSATGLGLTVGRPNVTVGASGVDRDAVVKVGITIGNPNVRIGLSGQDPLSPTEFGTTIAQPPVRVGTTGVDSSGTFNFNTFIASPPVSVEQSQ